MPSKEVSTSLFVPLSCSNSLHASREQMPESQQYYDAPVARVSSREFLGRLGASVSPFENTFLLLSFSSWCLSMTVPGHVTLPWKNEMVPQNDSSKETQTGTTDEWTRPWVEYPQIPYTTKLPYSGTVVP